MQQVVLITSRFLFLGFNYQKPLKGDLILSLSFLIKMKQFLYMMVGQTYQTPY